MKAQTGLKLTQLCRARIKLKKVQHHTSLKMPPSTATFKALAASFQKTSILFPAFHIAKVKQFEKKLCQTLFIKVYDSKP